MKKLLLLFILIVGFATLGNAQSLPRKGTIDSLHLKAMQWDSTGIPSATPPCGIGMFFYRGSLGYFVKNCQGQVRRVDSASVGGGTLVASDTVLMRNYSNSLYVSKGDSSTGIRYATKLDLASYTLTSALRQGAFLSDTTKFSLTTHNHTLDGLSNVLTTGKAAGNVLKWNGTNWVDSTDETGAGSGLVASDSTLMRNYSNALYVPKADSASGINYTTNKRLRDSLSTLRTDLKRIDDTTSGTGYVTQNDLTTGLATKLGLHSTADSAIASYKADSLKGYARLYTYMSSDTAIVSDARITATSILTAIYTTLFGVQNKYNTGSVTIDSVYTGGAKFRATDIGQPDSSLIRITIDQ